MSTRFSTLPSDCVQLIFDRIPSQNLLLISRVSRNWQYHQQLNCSRRKSLIIRQGKSSLCELTENRFNQRFLEHNIDHYGNFWNHEFFNAHNQIVISDKTNPKVHFVVFNFPNLHTLVLATDCIVSRYLKSFTQLITSYSSKLVTLKLYLNDANRNDVFRNRVPNSPLSKIVENLINQLNFLTAMQHLTIQIHDRSIEPSIENPEFIARLKEFYFDFGYLPVNKAMLEWMRKYDGRLDQLKRFYLTIDPIDRHPFQMNQIDKVFLANLYSFLPYEINYFNEEDLKRIVTRFPSLITFEYTLSNRNINSFTKLITILSPLTKLVHLTLNIEVVQAVEPFSALKSVKALELFFDNFNSNLLPTFCRTQLSTIVQCFPNLESIQIIAENYASSSDDSEDDSKDPDDSDSVDDYDNGEIKLENYAKQFFVNLKVAYKKRSLRTKFVYY